MIPGPKIWPPHLHCVAFLLLLLFPFWTGWRCQAQQAGWRRIEVPGAWEEKGDETLKNYDGFACYRTWLKPHDSFFTPHERNLFAESVTFNVRRLADAHELFINGVRVGSGGSFPPHFESSRTGNQRHKVPPGLLKKGEWNEILIRVYNQSGPGGFLDEAPFIMDYFNECVLQGVWEFRTGDFLESQHPVLKTRPEVSGFDQFHESRRVLGESDQTFHGHKLSPSESQEKFHADPQYVFDQMLSEPLVAQPTHLSFDERGRLWVSQYRQYPYPAGLKMLSRDKYYRGQYDKTPPPPPGHDRGRDVISIHEDTDGDGLFDRHKVFLDGLNLANAAIRGRGGVWVMHTPYLLFYPDQDFDDVPDGPPVVHLSGFGLEDTHSVANGLVWGMDGWIYGGQGSTTTSRVIRPGLDPEGSPGVYYEGCMVWRYHPENRVYEVFAEGSGNTFGLEVDAEGRLYSGHNGGETRGWHYVQGGYYLKQGKDPGKFGPSRNPYVFGELPWIRSASAVQRFSHLFAVGEGSALPQAGRGKLYSIDPLHSLIQLSERKPSGSTFESVDIAPVLTSADEGFRPVFIVNGADGGLYVADFYEQYIAHGQHYQSQIDPTTGRIYRLRGRTNQLERDLNLAARQSPELIKLLDHPNKWHRQTAVRLLGERKDLQVVPHLEELLRDPKASPTVALHALWALHQMGRTSQTLLRTGLRHEFAAVRCWAVRFAGDLWGRSVGLASASPRPASLPLELEAELRSMARNESDAEVRSQLAASARRFPKELGLSIVGLMIARDSDATDPFIPALEWWVVENAITQDRTSVLSWLEDRGIWGRRVLFEQLLGKIMRRYAAAGTRQDYAACVQLLKLSPSPLHTARLISGFEEAFKAGNLDGLPEELVRAVAASGGQSLVFRLRAGTPGAITEAFSRLKNSTGTLDERLALIRTVSELRLPGTVDALLDLVADPRQKTVHPTALTALSAFDDPRISGQVLKRWESWETEARNAASSLLVSRPQWTLELLDVLERAEVGRFKLSSEIQDRLLHTSDLSMRLRAEKLFQKRIQSVGITQQMQKIQAVLKGAPGDPYAGEKIFSERCAACHRLFFKGGSVGPDLTPYQRDHLDTLLMSILNPNAEIREGYTALEVETKDGRSLAGFAVEKDQRVIVLRTLGGELVTLRLDEVLQIQPTGRSLMPEGLIDDLGEQQLRDFFAYLRSSQPFTK